MEPERVGVEGIYIDALFKDAPYIWTGDEYNWTDKGDASHVWVVYFLDGYCDNFHVSDDIFIRAVR